MTPARSSLIDIFDDVLLARMPLEAVVRAEPHKDSVEIILRALGGETSLIAIAVLEPRGNFAARKHVALNVARRLNRDITMLPTTGVGLPLGFAAEMGLLPNPEGET